MVAKAIASCFVLRRAAFGPANVLSPDLGRSTPRPAAQPPMAGAQHNVPSPAKWGKVPVGRMGALACQRMTHHLSAFHGLQAM